MARVGVVPEEPDAPSDMTAGELLAFCAPLYAKWDDAAARARLERSDVPLGLPFGQLSKGQKGAVSPPAFSAASSSTRFKRGCLSSRTR
jgi:ABC-type multidrug transport system ATPase subunit